MDGSDYGDDDVKHVVAREFTKPQRRVLGVLVEKAYTVPESYPLTIKSLISGCNQKSNRDPVTNYNEDAIVQALEDLRSMGVLAVVHTESGRTERYRHYIRKRYPFSESQIAILAELWLRGRQQLGELRARASRMVPIESLADLKAEIEGLLEQGFVQLDGPVDRRGVEIDHNFYLATENASISNAPSKSPATAADATAESDSTESRRESNVEFESLKAELESVKQELRDLKQDFEGFRQRIGDL